MMCPPPSAPPGPEATLMPDPGPGEVPAAATAPPPALSEVIEPPPRQAPIPVAEASGQHFQDPAPAEPPKLYPPLPMQKLSQPSEGRGSRHGNLEVGWRPGNQAGGTQQLPETPRGASASKPHHVATLLLPGSELRRLRACAMRALVRRRGVDDAHAGASGRSPSRLGASDRPHRGAPAPSADPESGTLLSCAPPTRLRVSPRPRR
ncbi:hypothetical protein AB1E18_017498 [Capra hircus]